MKPTDEPKLITRQATATRWRDSELREHAERARQRARAGDSYAAHDVFAQWQARAEAFEALGPTPDPDAVDVLMKSPGFCTPGPCDVCGATTGALVKIGIDWDSAPPRSELCRSCIAEALALFPESP